MNVFDVNVHFHQVMENDLHSATQTEDAARSLKTESTMDVSDYIECIERNADEWRKTCQSANFMFFNHSLFEGTTLSSVVQRIQAQFPGSACTALMNVEKPARLEVLRNLKSIGFCASQSQRLAHGLAHLLAEVRLEGLQMVHIDGDADLLLSIPAGDDSESRSLADRGE